MSYDIPTPEEIEAEVGRPFDSDDLDIIATVLVEAGVLGTTLGKVRRMLAVVLAQEADDADAAAPGNFA